ncbi:MAG: hypothetical protein IKZ88_06345 [Neisseriaceae bacterium]|nr:hypothetical protein [Neisseriaceae bacterium]
MFYTPKKIFKNSVGWAFSPPNNADRRCYSTISGSLKLVYSTVGKNAHPISTYGALVG